MAGEGMSGFEYEWVSRRTVPDGYFEASLRYFPRKGRKHADSSAVGRMVQPVIEALLDVGAASVDSAPNARPYGPLGDEFAQVDGVPELTRQSDVDLAARYEQPYGKIKQARNAAKRTGEETQDDGGWEPA